MPEKNYIFLYFSLLIITPYHTDFLSCCFLYSRFQWNTLTEKKNRNQFLNNGMHYPVANDHYERTSIQFVLPFTRFVSYQFIKHKNSKLASAHSQSRITMAFVFFFSFFSLLFLFTVPVLVFILSISFPFFFLLLLESIDVEFVISSFSLLILCCFSMVWHHHVAKSRCTNMYEVTMLSFFPLFSFFRLFDSFFIYFFFHSFHVIFRIRCCLYV